MKTLRTDKGGEFCNAEMENYLHREGIFHQKTNAYTHKQNSVCERAYRTIIQKSRCLLFYVNLRNNFWSKAANTAAYIKNRSVISSLENKTLSVWQSCNGTH